MWIILACWEERRFKGLEAKTDRTKIHIKAEASLNVSFTETDELSGVKQKWFPPSSSYKLVCYELRLNLCDVHIHPGQIHCMFTGEMTNYVYFFSEAFKETSSSTMFYICSLAILMLQMVQTLKK